MEKLKIMYLYFNKHPVWNKNIQETESDTVTELQKKNTDRF